MKKYAALPPMLAPRLISREAAAAYLSIGTTKFDEMVRDRRMPAPKRIDGRKLWDLRQLDEAADNLPTDGHDEADETWADIDAA